MTRGGVVHPALKPSDVHSTGTKRDETKHFKEDKRAYTQVYLARARIEGIERWRAAVDAALQPATEGGEEQETKMNRWSADETVKQPKMEATGDVPVEVLEREVCPTTDNILPLLTTLSSVDCPSRRNKTEAPR